MSKKAKIWTIAGISAVILCIAAAVLVPVCYGYFSDKTFPKLTVGNMEAGGRTASEIIALTETETAEITVNWEGTEFKIDLMQAGLVPDAEKTADEALKAGRENIGKMISSFYTGLKIPLSFQYSENAFHEALTASMTELGILTGSYSVEVNIHTADFTVNEEAGEPDTNSLAEEIMAAYPDISKTFTLNKSEFKWPTAEQIRSDFDSEASDAYMEKTDGVVKIVGHKEGRKIDFKALTEAIDKKEKTFTVPYEVIKPKVYTDQLGDENFPVLLGKCVTVYNEGAVNRSINVKLAASKINGYVMNKGDVFSFNNVVGKRTHAAGFKSAPVYTGTGVEDGVGGGICQVSSTLYGAVLQANLKIAARTNHSYVVSYTQPGLDATVSYGTIDFKFQNPFDQPVKIKASAVNGAMTVWIYGTKQNNNTVSLGYEILSRTPREVVRVYNPELPVGTEKVTTAGYDGMKVRNYKYIKDASGTIISTENLGTSNYITLSKRVEYNDGKGESQETSAPAVQESESAVIPAEPSVPVHEPVTEIPEPPDSTVNSEEAPVLPVNPTQPSLELDPEYSGAAVPEAESGQTEETTQSAINELEDILTE